MSIDRMIDDFKNAFSNNIKSYYQRKENIKKIWEDNPKLQAILKGQSIYENDLEYKIFLSEQIKIFRTVLASRFSYIISEFWENNERLHEWYSGKPVLINGVHQSIPFDDLLADYQDVLISTYSPIARFIWQNNSILRAWLSGKSIILDGVDQTIPKEEMLDYFKSILTSRCSFVINAIWDANEKLREAFRQPSTFEILLKNFKSALSSRNRKVIEAMWNIPSLKKWLTGDKINFGTDEQPCFRQISNHDLIFYFKSVLSSQDSFIINAMWENNIALQDAIKLLNKEEGAKLFKNIMSSSKTGKSDFINQYIIWMNDIDLVKSLLKELNNHFMDDQIYRISQMSMLENFINKKESVVPQKKRKIEENPVIIETPPIKPVNNWYRSSHFLLFSNDNNVSENDGFQKEKVEDDNIILDQPHLDHFSFYSNNNMQELDIIEQDELYDGKYWSNF